MARRLLERDEFLDTLDALLRESAEEHGRIALVSGEAGIGKTALIERFLERRQGYQGATRTLWGACEALFTPRPLGPLYDIAQQARTPLRDLLDADVNRATLFAAVLDELATGGAPTVVVFEDVHWADEATLDLITFLARRIHRIKALLIVTYRDEGLGRERPLRLVLGELPAHDITRLRLLPLSEAAVATLADEAQRSGEELYRATGGNPFFLTEALASDAPGVPRSVADAVLAQFTRRSPEAQRLLELVAVAPTKIEWRIVEAADGAYAEGLEECLTTGMLQLEGAAIGYRHELARQAVESALAPARRKALNAQVLRALLEHGGGEAPLARLAHHAAQAEDAAAVLRLAPVAARQAAAHGAHREAAAHYETALRYADGLDMRQRVELLDALSYEYTLISRIDDAIQAAEAALAIWRALDETERVGHDLRLLSTLEWHLGHNVRALQHAVEAVELLETLPVGRELAMAYAQVSANYMVASDTAQTVAWGMRALELAERLGDTETICRALCAMGTEEWSEGDGEGLRKLERSLRLALEYDHEEQAARAYVNLADTAVKQRNFVEATQFLREGIAYCIERDLYTWGHNLLGIRARMRLDLGDYAGASDDVSAILRAPETSTANRGPALIALGLVRARRGDPGVRDALDEARDLALAAGEMQGIAPMAAARAEWRWLQGDLEQCAREAAVGVQAVAGLRRRWYLGEVAVWLWRSGGSSRLAEPLGEVAAPFALEMAGDWQAAAAEWERRGCHYEQALALSSGDERAQRAALSIFEQMGVAPAAEVLRTRLRTAGAAGVPRGPRPTTRANPRGLTNRQLEILLLMGEGLRNAQIAGRLCASPKTVEHHVSAVLTKLGVSSRAEAVHVAHQLGLLPPSALSAEATALPAAQTGKMGE